MIIEKMEKIVNALRDCKEVRRFLDLKVWKHIQYSTSPFKYMHSLNNLFVIFLKRNAQKKQGSDNLSGGEDGGGRGHFGLMSFGEWKR